MKYQEATAIVGRKSGLYDVTASNGTHQKRLFISQDGRLCEFAPRSRTKGYPIESRVVEQWKALNPAEPKTTNIVQKFQRYAAKADFTSPFIRKYWCPVNGYNALFLLILMVDKPFSA